MNVDASDPRKVAASVANESAPRNDMLAYALDQVRDAVSSEVVTWRSTDPKLWRKYLLIKQLMLLKFST